MIVKISHSTANLLTQFIVDSQRMYMPKKYGAALSRLKSDVRTLQVNSDRFQHALPIIRQVHSNLHTLVAQVYRWKRIKAWKKWLVLPALFDYVVFILPGYYGARGKLNKVAKEVKALEKACSLGGKG
jgi:hypothetical protein